MVQPVIYFSVRQYLESCQSLQAKIDGLQTVIINMITAYATMATSGAFEPYKFDDGQSRIEITYQNPLSMVKAIQGLQLLQNMLRAQQFNNANGRVSRMVPGENFLGGNYYNGW